MLGFFTLFLSETDNHLYATTLFLIRLYFFQLFITPHPGFLFYTMTYHLQRSVCVYTAQKCPGIANLLFCLVLTIFEHLLFWVRKYSGFSTQDILYDDSSRAVVLNLPNPATL